MWIWRSTYNERNITTICNLLSDFTLPHWSWQIRPRQSTGLQAVGSDVTMFSPSSVLAQIKSMLGFLGQRRAFIIDYEKSDTVAAPTVENIHASCHLKCITSCHNDSMSLNVWLLFSRLEGFPWFLESGGGELLSRRTKAEESENRAIPTSSCFLLSLPSSAPIISPSPLHTPTQTPAIWHLSKEFFFFSPELSSKKHTALVVVRTSSYVLNPRQRNRPNGIERNRRRDRQTDRHPLIRPTL